MTAVTKPATALAIKSPEATAAKQVNPEVAAAKARRDYIAQIRGTVWGKDCSPEVTAAIARWALDNGVDAVRHVEVLGARIYLNGDFYLEKAAPLVIAGELIYDEPQFVHADPGLITMANRKIEDAPEWEQPQIAYAREELFRRFQARVDRGVPHDATGACVFVVRTKNGATPLVGVNWCGGASKVKRRKYPKAGEAAEYRDDPVGDAEPTKTAHTRAARRALRQIIEAFPDSPLARVAARIEASAKAVSREIEEIVGEEREIAPSPHPAPLLLHGEDPYATGATLDGVAIETAGRTPEDEEFEKSLNRDSFL